MSVYALVVGFVGCGFIPCRAPGRSMSFRCRCRACRALSPSCRHLARSPATQPPALLSAMCAGMPGRRRDAAALVADGLFAPRPSHAVGGVASATVQACWCRSKRSRRGSRPAVALAVRRAVALPPERRCMAGRRCRCHSGTSASILAVAPVHPATKLAASLPASASLLPSPANPSMSEAK